MGVIICQKTSHPGEETENGMVRGLQNRHVQLIAVRNHQDRTPILGPVVPFFDRALYYF